MFARYFDTAKFMNDFSFYDVATYGTLGIGYIGTIVGASHLNLLNFTLFTLTNLCWIAVYHWYTRYTTLENCIDDDTFATQPRFIWPVIALCVISLLILVQVKLGVSYDWVITMVTTGVIASTRRIRQSIMLSSVYWIIVYLLAFMMWGFTSATIANTYTLLPSFIFIFAFSTLNSQFSRERDRSALLVTKLETAQAKLQAYAGEVEELATIRERNRIAREIHDTLGHSLTILSLKLETAVQLEERGQADLHQELVEARRLVKDCLTEVRYSVSALRPGENQESPFMAVLHRLIREFESVSPTTAVTMDIEDEVLLVSPRIRATLFRCIQEALTNIRKHAQATKVLIRLRSSANGLELTVLDNGIGQLSLSDAHQPGYGMQGMRERIALLNGTVLAGPMPDHGWRVDIWIPESVAIEVAV